MDSKNIIRTIVDEDNNLSEYQLEGEEDFISKAEAIRLADIGGVNAKVIRPKKGAPYLRAKADKTKTNNLRKIAVRRTCGPEVGSALRAALYRALRDFRNGWGKTGTAAEDEKHAACESLYNWNPVRIAEQYYDERLRGVTRREEYYAWESWDIVDFFTPNFVDGNLGATARKGCAAPYPCNITVRIYGKCHKAWAANYVLFGWMWYIAANGDPLRFYNRVGGGGGRPPRPMPGRPRSVEHVQRVLRAGRFSEEAMETRVRLWQEANSIKSDLKRRFGLPEYYQDEHTEMKIAWAKAGYNGWPNSPKKLTLPTHPLVAKCWGKCSEAGPAQLPYSWNTHRGV